MSPDSSSKVTSCGSHSQIGCQWLQSFLSHRRWPKFLLTANLESLKLCEQGRDCGAVLNPFCYVDFHSKSLLPSLTAKACSMLFFLCFDASTSLTRLDVPILPHSKSFSSETSLADRRSWFLSMLSCFNALCTYEALCRSHNGDESAGRAPSDAAALIRQHFSSGSQGVRIKVKVLYHRVHHSIGRLPAATRPTLQYQQFSGGTLYFFA